MLATLVVTQKHRSTLFWNGLKCMHPAHLISPPQPPPSPCYMKLRALTTGSLKILHSFEGDWVFCWGTIYSNGGCYWNGWSGHSMLIFNHHLGTKGKKKSEHHKSLRCFFQQWRQEIAPLQPKNLLSCLPVITITSQHPQIGNWS